MKRQGRLKKPAVKPDKSKTLVSSRNGMSEEAALATLAVNGLAHNALTTVTFSRPALPELSLTECYAALLKTAGKAQAGNLEDLEAILAAQAVALNAIFTAMAQRALVNTGQFLDAADRYLRLALRAQSQCRATAETLALMKNPPIFAKQANLAQGPQQVNNVMAVASDRRARAGELEGRPNKLMETPHERLDAGATSSAGSIDQAMAPVATLDRPAHD